jgi:hypothetical protein
VFWTSLKRSDGMAGADLFNGESDQFRDRRPRGEHFLNQRMNTIVFVIPS